MTFKEDIMIQVIITPAAGKRLISKAIIQHAHVKKTLSSGTLVIIAGTTNGFIAEEILKLTGQNDSFTRRRFFRGITPASMSGTTAATQLRNPPNSCMSGMTRTAE